MAEIKAERLSPSHYCARPANPDYDALWRCEECKTWWAAVAYDPQGFSELMWVRVEWRHFRHRRRIRKFEQREREIAYALSPEGKTQKRHEWLRSQAFRR